MNGVERSNDGVVLKKCPFCGGKAYLETIPNLASNEYVVCCSNKECTGFYIGYGDIGLYGTKEGAINAWNTRKPLERVIERLEDESNFFRGEPMGILQKAYYCMGVEKAIEIIKEELM